MAGDGRKRLTYHDPVKSIQSFERTMVFLAGGK